MGKLKPKYEQGQRVTRGDQHTGRVQSVAYDGTFVYLVKWDVGRESTHPEHELAPGQLPSTYP